MKNKIIKNIKKKKSKGSVLLEAMIGILIFSFGIMGLSLFQALTIVNNTENALRAEASTYVSEIIGSMWAKPNSLPSFAVTDQDIPRSEIRLPEAKKTIALNGNVATITLTWKRPNDNQRAKLVVIATITPNG